jgi:hypothetical protein
LASASAFDHLAHHCLASGSDTDQWGISSLYLLTAGVIMFYSDVILSKKGKLSKVWLAAHAERRMTKAMILDTNIVKSVCE